MKKLVISLTVLSLLTCSAFSCGSKNSSSSIEEETSLTPEEEAEKVAELEDKLNGWVDKFAEIEEQDKKEISIEAENYFNAFYSHNYSALLPLAYPQKIADKLLKNSWYQDAFDEYTGSEANSDTSSVPEFEYNITVDSGLEDEEKEKIEDRWNKLANEILPGSNEYHILVGFNITVTITSNNDSNKKREIKARAVEDIDEGWKIIDEGRNEDICDAVNNYYSALFDESLTEDTFSLLFPQKIVDAMIKNGDFQDMIDASQSSPNASDTPSEPSREFEVMTINELDDHELRDIEITYNNCSKSSNCDGYECHITKGYDLIAIEMDKYQITQRVKAVYVEDDGWKLYVFDV